MILRRPRTQRPRLLRRLDVPGLIRGVSLEAGRGVVAAMHERPEDQAPGWRAEQLAVGFVRGVDAQQVALEAASRALARGLVDELRGGLGDRGDGPLTRALSAAAQRVVRDTARAVAAPLGVLAASLALGFVGTLLLRRAAGRR